MKIVDENKAADGFRSLRFDVKLSSGDKLTAAGYRLVRQLLDYDIDAFHYMIDEETMDLGRCQDGVVSAIREVIASEYRVKLTSSFDGRLGFLTVRSSLPFLPPDLQEFRSYSSIVEVEFVCMNGTRLDYAIEVAIRAGASRRRVYKAICGWMCR